MTEIDRIKENHTKQIEEKVCALIKKCRRNEEENIQSTKLHYIDHRVWVDTDGMIQKNLSLTSALLW